MALTDVMAYGSSDEMMFGFSRKPVTTRRGLVIGGGAVIAEVVPHPRPGSEKTMHTLVREFERANEDVLERCVSIGAPCVVLENEHVFQMTHDPRWGKEIAAQAARQIDEYEAQYGLKAAYRATIADLRKPDMVNIRDSERTRNVLDAFDACAEHADIVSIESIGGKEIFDHCIIRNDITGLLFSQAVLGSRDMAWLWPQIVEIANRHGAIPGGDTDCSQANTAMFMAGGFVAKDVPHTLAALSRAIGAGRSLVAYECGAQGPGKDCAYENPIIKAVTGLPMSTEGKTAACAHSSLCGNVMAAVCDLWANEAVEYHRLFGGSTPAVFAEILSYDVAAMNAAIDLGYEKQYQACLVHSDRYRSPHGFILCPDNAWAIGKALVDHNASYYARSRAAAMKCGELMLADPQLGFTAFEKESLLGYMKEMEALPEKEEDFIDLCLDKYRKVKGFLPEAYGL
ncbi:MAG TPA: methyltransferase MtaB domain-containing protein [Rhodocyclaceae bacterium]|nr:methyltransferase MtaB domain-containing protein [Rhodocyclaceae bacterium]